MRQDAVVSCLEGTEQLKVLQYIQIRGRQGAGCRVAVPTAGGLMDMASWRGASTYLIPVCVHLGCGILDAITMFFEYSSKCKCSGWSL